MSRNLRHWVISLFILLAWGSGWLMLWTLGFYLTHNGQQAALFLPHGVYLALLILLSRRYWPALILPAGVDVVLAAQRAITKWLYPAGCAVN